MHRVGETATNAIKNLVMGAVGFYTLERALDKTLETAEELVTTSQRLGIGVEQLQILRQAAKDNSVEFSLLASTLEKVNIARSKALGGGADAAKMLRSFATLGVTLDMLLTQSAGNLAMGPIADTLKTTNPQQLSGVLRDVLGKGFGPDIAVLKTDFGELGEKMRKMGAIMDASTAVELKAFKDEMGLIGSIIITQLAPVLVQLGEAAFKAFALLQEAGTMYGTLVADWMNGNFRGSWKYAVEAGRDKKSDMDAILDAFHKKINDIANNIRNPKVAVFETEQGSNSAMHKKAVESDSLTRVGNFLGVSKAAITGAAEKAALQTATNTNIIAKATVSTNENIARILGVIGGKGMEGAFRRSSGTFNDTAYPSN